MSDLEVVMKFEPPPVEPDGLDDEIPTVARFYVGFRIDVAYGWDPKTRKSKAVPGRGWELRSGRRRSDERCYCMEIKLPQAVIDQAKLQLARLNAEEEAHRV